MATMVEQTVIDSAKFIGQRQPQSVEREAKRQSPVVTSRYDNYKYGYNTGEDFSGPRIGRAQIRHESAESGTATVPCMDYALLLT